jgi:hypothetical protein
LERLANDGCIDNHRFAFLDEPEAVEEFKKQESMGCCGFLDFVIMIKGRLAIIGLNYGH